MAIRLIEMHRILKDTGSIYLHCNQTMSHSLKLVMDSIFSNNNFVNEIIWKSTTGEKSSTKSFPNDVNTILFYKKKNNIFNMQYEKISIKYVESNYKFEKVNKETGKLEKYQAQNLGGPKKGGGYFYDFYGYKTPKNGWLYPKKTMENLKIDDLLHYPKTKKGIMRQVWFASKYKGKKKNNIWTDIACLHKNKEVTDYKTQKPLALVDRIIKASSEKGDLVLDPFCGCATACISAEKLGRKWIGIDISDRAGSLIKQRLKKDLNLKSSIVSIRKDLPIKNAPKPSREIKHILYGKQEGNCEGCEHYYPIRNMTIDHIIPTSKGGQDTDQNLQLLCGFCNSFKGDRSMSYLRAGLIRKLESSGEIIRQKIQKVGRKKVRKKRKPSKLQS